MKKTQYVSLIKALIPCSETSLSYSDVLGLAVNILLSSPTFEQYRLPPSEYQSDFLMKSPSGYGSVIYYDLDYAAKLINSIIYDDVTMEQYIELNPVETNNWYYEMTGSSGRRPSSNTTTSSVQQPTTSSTPEPVVSEKPDNTSSEEITSSEDVSSEESTSSEDASSEEITSSEDVSSDTPTESTDSDVTSSGEGDGNETPVTPPENEDPTENTTP